MTDFDRSDLEPGEERFCMLLPSLQRGIQVEFKPGRMLSIKILSDCIRASWVSGSGFDHAIWN